MNIFIAGMPRAGSMWTYNVARACLSAAGKQVLPVEPPVNDKDALRYALTYPDSKDSAYCVKTHEYLPLKLPRARFICNYRDVRDALISYMRFMKCDFPQGLKIVQAMMDLTDHYLSANDDKVLGIHYADVVAADTLPTVERIADFIGVTLPQAQLADIDRQFHKSEIGNLVNQLGAVDNAAADDKYTSAPNMDGTQRVYDKATGFQQNHITATVDAEWRTVLTKPQQAELQRLAKPWLVRYDFK